MSEIKSIKEREILDSKGTPTVEVEVITDNGSFRASIPSGVSRGKHEAVELRDEDNRFGGKGVLKAVSNINNVIEPELVGADPTKQRKIDELMIALDGTENKSNLGENAILPVSIAVLRAGAAANRLSLWQYISKIGEFKENIGMPNPCMLMVEGGLHGGGTLDTQEFMIVLKQGLFREKLRKGTEIYSALKKILEKEYGATSTNVGLEGGFAGISANTEKIIELILEAGKQAGYGKEMEIILDVAASHFCKDGKYSFEDKELTSKELSYFYIDLIKKYPILGLEDPFSEEDKQAWSSLVSDLGFRELDAFVIGDDLTVTNKKRIKQATDENQITGVIIKPNQAGTVTETIDAIKQAEKRELGIFVKHRSGETNDPFIADLAVGCGASCIMAGAPMRGERIAKYDRLLRIEEEINS